LKGLGITSVKWKCADRKPIYQIGDLVWADTIASIRDVNDDGIPYRDEFPAVVVNAVGSSKPLIFIDPGTKGRSNVFEFVSELSNGFCRIPLSRLRPREGERQKICPSCDWPEWKGHQPGYICAVAAGNRESAA
jgi:hypothetical protein